MSETAPENVSAEVLTNEETTTTNSEDQSIKVFVGNIEYKVTDEQLKEHFSSIKFDDLKISKRKDVSVGYGFITFSDEEEAKKCVSQFDKTELQGRPLKVELAKEKTETTRRSSRRSIRGRGRRNPNYRRNKKQNDKKEGKDAANASASEESSNEDNKNESSGSESANENGKSSKPRFRKNKRYSQRKLREGGEPSKTTIYVANLPFKTTEEKLKEAFADYEVSKVHVARFKTGKSKGYGFIEVENEEVQKKILCECTNKVIEGRSISLKVALNFTKEEVAVVEAAANESTEAIAVAAEQ